MVSCRETLKLPPYAEDRAELLKTVYLIEDDLKSDRIGYEKYLTSASEYTSIYQKYPLYGSAESRGRTSRYTTDEIVEKANAFYQPFLAQQDRRNPELEKLHRFYLTYDLICRMRYHRGADQLPGQHDIPEIVDHVTASRWFDEYLVRVTSRSAYAYRESYALRVIVALHTAAHFFQIPFPTLFCLVFQESKFDFTVTSGVGAVGLGQLTGMGVKQVNKLRTKADYEDRIQAATQHLARVYGDPVLAQVLDRLGMEHDFPAMPPRLPKTIRSKFPKAIDSDFLTAVARDLKKQGLGYADNMSLLRAKCRLMSRGMMMPDRYVAIHGVYNREMERRFGHDLGNVYNPETNILYSAALLRYYMKYRWWVSGSELEIRPLVRSMAAVVSYNQGQTGVRRYFKQAEEDFPNLDLSRATLEQLSRVFTRERISLLHRGKTGTVQEIYKHATFIGTCSCRGFQKKQ